MANISPNARTVAGVHYQNGRWGSNFANVLDNDGEFLFFNGYGDPVGCASFDAAMETLAVFVAAKTIDSFTNRYGNIAHRYADVIRAAREHALDAGNATAYNALDSLLSGIVIAEAA